MHSFKGRHGLSPSCDLIGRRRGPRPCQTLPASPFPRPNDFRDRRALVALEPRDDDERALGPDHANDVAEHVVDAPLLQRFVEALEESVVDNGAEILAVDAVVSIRQQQFFRPNQAEGVEQFRAERVVTGLSAVEREERHLRPLAPAEHRQHAAMFVIRVGGRVQDGGGRAGLTQFLPCPAAPGRLEDSDRRCRG